jgi:hypothetical protein
MACDDGVSLRIWCGGEQLPNAVQNERSADFRALGFFFAEP